MTTFCCATYPLELGGSSEKGEEEIAVSTSSISILSMQSAGDGKCNGVAQLAVGSTKKIRLYRKNRCKAPAPRPEKSVKMIHKPNSALSVYRPSFQPSVAATKCPEPSSFSFNSKSGCANKQLYESRQLETVEIELLDDAFQGTSKVKSKFDNLHPPLKDFPPLNYSGILKLGVLSSTPHPIISTSNGKSSRSEKFDTNLVSKILKASKNGEGSTTDGKKVHETTFEFATLHEYLSQKPLQDKPFWKKFDNIFENVPTRQYTVTDLNILVTIYEKLNLKLFEESERPTQAADTSDRSVLSDNIFCSVTVIENDHERMWEVTPCWSSPDQYRLYEARFVNFMRLQALMVLSATCMLLNADKEKFGEVLAYAHLVKAAYDTLENLLLKVNAGGVPIAPWRERVFALLSYAYYKLYLQQDKWHTYEDSYKAIQKLTRNAWFEVRIVGVCAVTELEWPKSWEDLLLRSEGFFSDRVSLTGRELWRSAAIAALCLDARTRNSGSAEEPSSKKGILEDLQRFTSAEDPVLQAVLSLKKFQFCYRRQWKKSWRPSEDTYSKKSLCAFQQAVGCMLEQYRSMKDNGVPAWVMVRFRSQLLETVMSHVILLVIRSDQDALKVSIKVLEDLILDDFLAPDGNVDTDESAHFRLASHSTFYFLTRQMTGRSATSSAYYDSNFALAVYSKLYIRKCVVNDFAFSLAVQIFERPIDAFLKCDNCEKELLRTLLLMMPMLYERFSYECSLLSIGYTPKRYSSMAWLDIADETQLMEMYNKLRKEAHGKETEVKEDISTQLEKHKEIEEDDSCIRKEYGTIKTEDCSSCHLTDSANTSALDRTLDVSSLCNDVNSSIYQGIRGTLYIRDDCSGQKFPSYKEAAPETKACIKSSSKTETGLNQSRLEDEIVSLHHIGNNFLTNCAPVRVLQPENYFIFRENDGSHLHGLSSMDPCFLESSRNEEDLETEMFPDLEASIRSCNTLTNDTLNNASTRSSAICSEDDVQFVTNEKEMNLTSISFNANRTLINKTTIMNNMTKSSMTSDSFSVSSDEVQVFLGNALPFFPPGEIGLPLKKIRAALCNSLLRVRDSKDWAEREWSFEKCGREKFEAAMDEVLQKKSEPPLKHLVDIFDYVFTAMNTFLYIIKLKEVKNEL